MGHEPTQRSYDRSAYQDISDPILSKQENSADRRCIESIRWSINDNRLSIPADMGIVETSDGQLYLL
jgi:hypothetical protein